MNWRPSPDGANGRGPGGRFDLALMADLLRLMARSKARPVTRRAYCRRQRERALANLRRYGPLVRPGSGADPSPPA